MPLSKPDIRFSFFFFFFGGALQEEIYSYLPKFKCMFYENVQYDHQVHPFFNCEKQYIKLLSHLAVNMQTFSFNAKI